MVNAIVLLKVARDKINSAAEMLIGIKGIDRVNSVAGKYDLAVTVKAKDNEELAEVVTNHVLKVGGIKSSETLFSFRVYSKYESARMFSFGMAYN